MSMTIEGTSEQPVTRARVEWALVPKVNLLPPEILQARRFRHTQRVLAGVLAATVLVAGVATVLAEREVGAAADDLQRATSRTTTLQAQEQRYAEVPRVLAQVAAASSARQAAMADDVLWYRFLGDLAVATPQDVRLGSVSVVQGASVAGTSADPLVPAGRGSVTVSGSALRFPDVAAWLTQVGQVHGLDAAQLQTAARDGDLTAAGAGRTTGKVTFTSSVVITADALSHRYDRKAP